jgi:hypothetical protein
MATLPNFFKEFLDLQGSLTRPTEIRKPKVIKPTVRKMEEETMDYDYIITKKPKPAKVLKYLQGMIDDIVAENDDA